MKLVHRKGLISKNEIVDSDCMILFISPSKNEIDINVGKIHESSLRSTTNMIKMSNNVSFVEFQT